MLKKVLYRLLSLSKTKLTFLFLIAFAYVGYFAFTYKTNSVFELYTVFMERSSMIVVTICLFLFCDLGIQKTEEKYYLTRNENKLSIQLNYHLFLLITLLCFFVAMYIFSMVNQILINGFSNLGSNFFNRISLDIASDNISPFILMIVQLILLYLYVVINVQIMTIINQYTNKHLIGIATLLFINIIQSVLISKCSAYWLPLSKSQILKSDSLLFRWGEVGSDVILFLALSLLLLAISILLNRRKDYLK